MFSFLSFTFYSFI